MEGTLPVSENSDDKVTLDTIEPGGDMLNELALKRELRSLKKLEKKIRFGYEAFREEAPRRRDLVWNEFFSTKTEDDTVKYPFRSLLSLGREEWKEIVEEYFCHVYYQHYRENGLFFNIYDPALLSVLGLRPGVGLEAIKSKFRLLVKKHHPDQGGEAAKMIEILEAYNKLTGK